MDLDPANQLLADLLARIGRGEATALAALYERTSGQLFAVLIRILRRRELAEEALQDVFVRIWNKAASYRPTRGTAMTWLISLARYRAIDLKRRARREVGWEERPDGFQDDPADPAPDPMAQTFLGIETQRLQACFEGLGQGQRHSIRLTYLEGLTQEEAARALQTPLGTVKSWIRRGLQALKECLSR